MPQLDPSSFASQLFWLFITFLALYVVMKNFILPMIEGTFATRNNKINSDLDSAKLYEQRITEMKNKCDSIVADSRNEADKIIAEASARAKEIIQQSIAVADSRIAQMLIESEVSLEKNKEVLSKKLTDVTLEVASLMASKVSGSNINADVLSKYKH